MSRILRAALRVTSLAVTIMLLAPPVRAQQVGDRVVVNSSNTLGAPVHPAPGDMIYVRWANGTTGTITAIDSATQWRQVESNGVTGWIVRRYLTVVPADPDAEPDAGTELPTYAVGAWNLEWFHDNKARGFPEYTRGGPTYPARTDADYEEIASTIRDRLEAHLMVLSEINGADSTRSVEMDRLLSKLGGPWAYFLAPDGGAQRLAVLYDSATARRDRCVQVSIPRREVQNKDIFDRDPLVCSFTFLDGSGTPKNDLLVVALHLASGQSLVANHDTAMALLRRKLATLTSDGTFSSGERDVLIMGDFNASRYDNRIENFWEQYDSTGFRFRTLSPEDGNDYPGTRLAGVPLAPTSQIDYVLASAKTGGLLEKLAQPVAEVRVDLLPTDFNLFRQHLSDHLPVMVRIRLMADDDP